MEFFFVCLGVFRPTREFFSHLETSPLPVKGCKFWPILGTHGHWAVRSEATCTVTRACPFKWSFPSTRDTHTYCRAFGSGAVTTCFNDSGLSPRLNPGLPDKFGIKCLFVKKYFNVKSLNSVIKNYDNFRIQKEISWKEFLYQLHIHKGYHELIAKQKVLNIKNIVAHLIRKGASDHRGGNLKLIKSTKDI